MGMHLGGTELTPTSTRLASKARTRAKVLTGTRAMLNESGYEETGIRDIARKINMSTGAVFANFGSKAALVSEVAVVYYEEMRGRLQKALEQEGSVVDVVISAFDSEYREAAGLTRLMQTLVGADWHHGPEFSRPRSSIIGIHQLLQRVLGRVMSHEQAEVMGWVIWDTYLGMYRPAIGSATHVQRARRFTRRVHLLLGPYT